jgi:hypothetical protein
LRGFWFLEIIIFNADKPSTIKEKLE